MSVFCITFSVHYTLKKVTIYTTDGLDRLMLANSSIMLVKSLELRVSFSILSSARLINLLFVH